MNASKENAQRALDILEQEGNILKVQQEQFLREFLEAALKKLPTEAAYQREAERSTQRRERKETSK